MAARAIVIALFLASLCSLALCEAEVDSFSCQVMVGSYYYDLSPLQRMDDQVYEDMGTRSAFYFAVCRDTYHSACGGNPACSVDQHGSTTVMGELGFSSWSSEFTSASSGIALVYEHGDNCSEYSKHSTTIIFNCDHTVDYYLVDLSTHYCGAIATVRSRYACPLEAGQESSSHHHHHEDSSSSANSDVWWITLTSIGGAVLLCIALVVVVAAGACIIRRARKSSWASVPQDEEAGKKWSQEDDIDFGRNSVPMAEPMSGNVVTPGYAVQSADSYTSPQYIQAMS
eukprot:CAMPEP_0114624638 /NCGR_PEP_ID=MMETSP0168-20121206/10867_1 /TAXON_ID=95228 ORGANISM="Vannella sp., Strain DIVA3 517/6/12" /NCGR_SAMPLE_ID=MMETSP0168 /ASSEMBLY_ACC=CAM_ASM_000044 /LENGTH=284 /DNA_ID=CAMNT_0001835913 /DNA_START=46 /DNA_END=900 /DNA_ORIENTATION=-